MNTPAVIVGHLAPDLDCLVAIWQLVRFGGAVNARFAFVPAGKTLDNQRVDSDPMIVHVDTGGGQFDHHHSRDRNLSASELVRRVVAPNDRSLRQLVEQVTRIDNATATGQVFFNITDLISGYNMLYPNRPEHVVEAMLPNLDAWYEHEARELRRERAFQNRIEFETPWGLGIAMESDDGASSRLAYQHGAVLYAYRDSNGWMGIAARARSDVDLEPIYAELREVDGDADWYLHPGRRMLLCGTPKSPPRRPSHLSLEELVGVLRGDSFFSSPYQREVVEEY